MTITEILKAKGVSDELIQAIQADMKANSIYTASEENLDIRYGKLKTQHESTAKQLDEANTLIETLKKSTKGQEDAQQKISAYEQQVTQLQAELEQTKLESAIKVELLAAKAMDVDYLTFKLKEKGELALDEQGKIKGWDDKLAGLKTQFPTQFEAEGKKQVIENKLPTNGEHGEKTVTKEEFAKMGYGSRVALRQENPELYDQMMKG
jgi:vacuolar-type H+-ATPase subunit I/STV1